MRGCSTRSRIYFERRGPDGRAADPLLAVLGRVKPRLRAKVVRLLGQVRATRALPEIRTLLDNHDSGLRLAAVQAIGEIGDPQGAGPLLRLLGDDDAHTRFEAAVALGKAASAQTVHQLVERLDAREPVDRQAVLVALGGALTRLGRGPHPPLPLPVATEARRALVAAARSPDESLAAAALDALGRWGDAPTAPALAALLEARRPAQRREAAVALGAFDAPAARAALRSAVDGSDTSPALLAAAAAALGEHGDATDVARLVRVAGGDAWPASAAAAFALARMARRGVPLTDATPALCRLARSRHPYIRANVAVAMAAAGGAACQGGPDPKDWLDPRHAPAVRIGAVHWIATAAAAGHVSHKALTTLLTHCVRSDLASDVVDVCRDAAFPPLDDTVDAYAYGADGTHRLKDSLVALRLADGTVLLTRTDQNGHVRLAHAPRGPMVLADPTATPLEP